ncbi:MAG: hypothetical protein J6O41_02230 [Clostridia bacterium]|nr:hypothetical protein [Clostridia bacterium]
MEITIEIIDRNYEQIKEFCEFNKITIEEYIVQCVEDDFFTRKYGDLNEKLNNPKIREKLLPEELKRQIDKISEYKKESENKIEKKKVGRPKKVKEETASPIENKLEEIINNENNEFLVRVEDTVNTNDNVGQTKIRKRTLKAK